MKAKFNEKFTEELLYKLVRGTCPSQLDEICGIELDNINDGECEAQDINECEECWKKAVEEWVSRQ